jgi:hypothetical protein
MQFTGNPFVDSGLAVMTHLTGRGQISELTRADVRSVVGDGSELAHQNSRLKSFTMVFGTNGPLTQHAYKRSGQNEPIYKSIVQGLLEESEKEGLEGIPCELTGIATQFDLHDVCAHALRSAGQKIPEHKWIGRDWVPLAGSLGNDAQALPGASRSLHVSATALLALQYLPLGLFLFQGRLTCFQSTHEPLTQQLTADIVEHNNVRLKAGNQEILGKGQGSGVLLDSFLRLFERLQDSRVEYDLPSNTSLLLWLFSNSGAGANCDILEIPDAILHFLWDACRQGYSTELRRLMLRDSKDPRQQLFTTIRENRDYWPLYPAKAWPGTSQAFYEFYQERVCEWPSQALAVAGRLVCLVTKTTEPKRLKELRKPEAFRAAGNRSTLRRLIAEHLNIEEYDALFPSRRHPLRTKSEGWNLIRFYLGQTAIEDTPNKGVSRMKTTHPKVLLIADTYFRERGPTRVKNLLDRMSRGKAGLSWLREVFCKMAETHPDFELGEWDEFVCDEEGRPVPYELLFQIRLCLANRYRHATQ